MRRVAHLGLTHDVASVPAHVEAGANDALLVSRDDDVVVADVSSDVVPGFGDLTLVSEETPSPREEAFLLESEHRWIVERPRRESSSANPFASTVDPIAKSDRVRSGSHQLTPATVSVRERRIA